RDVGGGAVDYVAYLHHPPMSLSVPSAHRASTVTTMPTITAFHIAVTSALNPSTHGEIKSQIPSTTLAHSSHAMTLKSATRAASPMRIPRMTAFDVECRSV